MTINTLSSEIYMIDKDILSYVQATEQDQWDNFVLYDNYWSYCFLFKGLRCLLSEALYLQKKTTKITAISRKLTPPLAFFLYINFIPEWLKAFSKIIFWESHDFFYE